MQETDIIKRLEKLENRLSVLEGADKKSNELFLEIELPEADIGGLHFNRQFVKSIFELKDGNYYSKDILIHSARNVINNTDRDVLSEYLETDEVREAFANAYNEAIESNEIDTDEIKVFIPSENQGVKTYNGVTECYWLKEKSNTTTFVYVYNYGNVSYGTAGNAHGLSPVFCIAG